MNARVLGLPLSLVTGLALANPMPVEYWFSKRPPFTEDRVRITDATFDDEVCLHIKGFASDGEHLSEITVFDAAGRETARLIGPVLARGATWRRSFCPAPIKDVDAPGEWWFVVTLDGMPVVSASILLAYGKPKSSAPAKSAARPALPATGARDR